MNTTLSDQIRAIQTARRGAAMLVRAEDISEFDKALNDAASTIAALNLTKDLPKEPDPVYRLERPVEGGFIGTEMARVKEPDQSREEYTEQDMIDFADFKACNMFKHSDQNGFYIGTPAVLKLFKELKTK